MQLRKIDLMHRQFGKTEGQICRDCSNLYRRRYSRTYIKCSVYGNSCSAATDWKVSYPACGMFNKEWNGNEICRLVRTGGARAANETEPLEGQLVMEL